MLIITFLWGKKYLVCDYDFKNMILYTSLAAVLYFVSCFTKELELVWEIIVNTLLLMIFAGVVFKRENLGPMFAKLMHKFKR